MPSIVNGLFAGRAGISSHGSAIAVVGDNISNSSTTGYKSSRAEFEDLIAGGNTSGKTIGSGSSIAGVSQIFEQGTLEFTGRPLDMAVDGNGYFVVAKDAQRFYTRAGNFKVNAAGFIVNQNNLAVLGFPANGSGGLEPININQTEQSSVATANLSIIGNIDASAAALPGGAADIPVVNATSTTTYSELANASRYSTVVDVFDSLGAAHTVTYFFFKTGSNTWQARGYVNSEEVGPATPSGLPRQAGGNIDLVFDNNGSITTGSSATGSFTAPWSNGSSPTQAIDYDFSSFTQYSAQSNVLSITQDGKGIGSVTSISIADNGTISALLSNGQSAEIGTVGLVNFANPEGLTRIGKNLLIQSPNSGEPIVGEPLSGTFGAVKAGSLELSTVDTASEFVKLITLQRGFQASSRIITTINQLLNEIIQLA